jgi:hypothetical protein
VPGAATIFAKQLDVMAAFYAVWFGLVQVAAEPGDYRVDARGEVSNLESLGTTGATARGTYRFPRDVRAVTSRDY